MNIDLIALTDVSSSDRAFFWPLVESVPSFVDRMRALIYGRYSYTGSWVR